MIDDYKIFLDYALAELKRCRVELEEIGPDLQRLKKENMVLVILHLIILTIGLVGNSRMLFLFVGMFIPIIIWQIRLASKESRFRYLFTRAAIVQDIAELYGQSFVHQQEVTNKET